MQCRTPARGGRSSVQAFGKDIGAFIAAAGAGPSALRDAQLLEELDEVRMDVAPAPVLVGLERLDDRVAGGTEACRRMPVRRRIAAADVAARQAHLQWTQVMPSCRHSWQPALIDPLRPGFATGAPYVDRA